MSTGSFAALIWAVPFEDVQTLAGAVFSSSWDAPEHAQGADCDDARPARYIISPVLAQLPRRYTTTPSNIFTTKLSGKPAQTPQGPRPMETPRM